MVTATSRMAARKTQRQDWNELGCRLFSEAGCPVWVGGKWGFIIGVLLGWLPSVTLSFFRALQKQRRRRRRRVRVVNSVKRKRISQSSFDGNTTKTGRGSFLWEGACTTSCLPGGVIPPFADLEPPSTPGRCPGDGRRASSSDRFFMADLTGQKHRRRVNSLTRRLC